VIVLITDKTAYVYCDKCRSRMVARDLGGAQASICPHFDPEQDIVGKQGDHNLYVWTPEFMETVSFFAARNQTGAAN